MSKFIITATAMIPIAVAAVFVACRKASAPLQVGGIYSTRDGKGGYRFVKLLAHGDGICHVRIYNQIFPTRQKTVDLARLSLGKPGDLDGFGIRHIPIREAGFHKWQPVLITTTAVAHDELEGYEIWKESSRGVF